MSKLNTGEDDKLAEKIKDQLTKIEDEIRTLGFLLIKAPADNSILQEDLAYVSGIVAALLATCRRATQALSVVRQDSDVDIDAIIRKLMKEPPK